MQRLNTEAMPRPDAHYTDAASGQRMPAWGLGAMDAAYAEIDRQREVIADLRRTLQRAADVLARYPRHDATWSDACGTLARTADEVQAS